MQTSTKVYISLFFLAPLFSVPAIILNVWKDNKAAILHVWQTEAFSPNPNWLLESLRWSLFLSLFLISLSAAHLILACATFLVRKQRTKLAYLVAIKPHFTFITILGTSLGWGSLLIYQSTLNASSVQINLKGFLITRYERLLLILGLFAGALFLVKYLMARINTERFNRTMSKRVQESDQQYVLLTNLYKTASNIKRRKSKTIIGQSKEDEEMEADAEKAKSFLEKKNPDVIAKTIASAYIKKDDTVLKVSQLEISFPPAEATAVFGMLAANVEGAQMEEGLTPGDIAQSVKNIFKESQNLENNVRSSLRLSRRLESTLLFFAFLLATLISLMVMHSDGYLFALQIIAIITGFGYLTEDTIKRIFNCFMFAFVQHPFDIGDAIKFDGKKWIVQQVNLFSMEAIAEDGLLTEIPVSNIASTNICNLTRSSMKSK